MESGRLRSQQQRMKGGINAQNELTDIYLPRKCDFTDKMIPSKDHSSIQLSICDVTLPPFRSTPTALSTFKRAVSSPSAASSDPPETVMPPFKKSSQKKD